MAPSRIHLNVIRRIASHSTPHPVRLRPRLLSTAASTTHAVRRAAALHAGPARTPHFPTICTRSYSQSTAASPEPPDYLNEAELHVFNKIKAELEPVKLEVHFPFSTRTELGALAWMTPIAIPITAPRACTSYFSCGVGTPSISCAVALSTPWQT